MRLKCIVVLALIASFFNSTLFGFCDTEARYIESFSHREDLLRAKGRGKKRNEIKDSAKRDAVCFVLMQGSQPLLDSVAKKGNAQRFEGEIFANISNYATIQGKAKSKKKEGRLYLFEYVVKVNKGNLKDFLVSKKIIQSDKAVSKALGKQSIMVIDTASEYDKYAQNTIEKYLGRRKFKIKKYKTPSKKDLQATMATLRLLYMEADREDRKNENLEKIANILNSGTDVYVETKSDIVQSRAGSSQVRKANVILRAYDTATGEIIGSSEGFSPRRSGRDNAALVTEATNDAANELTQAITTKWSGYLQDGKTL